MEKQRYFDLLTKLVKTKMQLDIEDSIEDDFDDLRKDFKNVVNNDVVKKLDILEKKNEEKIELLQKKNEELTRSLNSCQETNALILGKLEQVLSLLGDRPAESDA